MTTKASKFAGLLACLLLISACSGSGTPTGAVPTSGTAVNVLPGGNITIHIPGDFGGPGPGLLLNNSTSPIAESLYDTLVKIKASNGEVVPYLAESWTTTPTSVTFKIRQGATCSDGTPVTATVVANSLKRVVSPELKSIWPATHFGPGPYTVSLDEAARTVTFGVTKPNTLLLEGFANVHSGGIVCDAGLKASEADFRARSYGSGPFVIQTVVPQDRMVLKRRPEWKWGPGGMTANDSGFPDTLTFKVVTNSTTAANLLLTGSLDYIDTISGPDVQRLQADKSVTEWKIPAAASGGGNFNMHPTRASADKAVRQAIAQAINPTDYGNASGRVFIVNKGGMNGPSHRCYDADNVGLLPSPPGDLGKAATILQNAGYSKGSDGKFQKNGKPLHIVIIADEQAGHAPEYVAEQLTKLGVATTLNQTDNSTRRLNLFDGKYDLWVTPNGQNIPMLNDPAPPPQGGGFTFLDDPTLRDLFAKANADSTCEGWKAHARRVLTEQYVINPIVVSLTIFGRGVTVGDFSSGAVGGAPSRFGVRRTK